MITQSSPCPAPATAEDPPELLELLADAVDEPDAPFRVCTVTEEPPGMLLDPDSPPGPAVTVLDGPQFTTRQSSLLVPFLSVLVTTVELCEPVPRAVVVEDLLSNVAHGSFGCRFVSAPKAGSERPETTRAPPNASARKDEKVICFMLVCRLNSPP